eukprot:TRINITY_DN2452_c0_g1_i3.p1 TRINITY_DN2452_c0_g1~~TRINITY_DN2452_c0_g1_i3.p1  ORF type:complete len:144 (+),score=17.68 TRINITY_DN2452_c0_g1_i3:52-483(+)
MQTSTESDDLVLQSKGRQHRPESSHRAWNYFSHPIGHKDAEIPLRETSPTQTNKFGNGFTRRQRDTSIDIRKQAEHEAKEREKAKVTQHRREVLNQKDHLNGYDIINGTVHSSDRVTEGDRKTRPQRKHFPDRQYSSPSKSGL